jgi:hypothetical protein
VKAIGDNWEWSGIAQFTSGAPGSVDMSGTPNYTYGGTVRVLSWLATYSLQRVVCIHRLVVEPKRVLGSLRIRHDSRTDHKLWMRPGDVHRHGG